jgi:competence protein ComEA
MKRRDTKIGLFLILSCFWLVGYGAKDSPFKILESKNMKLQSADNVEKLDLNRADKQEMIARKISLKIVRGILEYREITGGFLEIRELERIKGIGPASYEKIAGIFQILEKATKKKFDINKADEKILLYYGFSKTEIREIIKYKSQKGRFRNNLDLMEILSEKRYEKYKGLVYYESSD